MGTTHQRIRQSKSSDALWLPGDTIESATANGNPLVPQRSRHPREEPALSISETQPVLPEELPGHRWVWLESTSAQIPAGISLSLEGSENGEECSWDSSPTLDSESQPRSQVSNSMELLSSSAAANAQRLLIYKSCPVLGGRAWMLAGHRDPGCSGLGAGRISSSPEKCSEMTGLSALVPQGKSAHVGCVRRKE